MEEIMRKCSSSATKRTTETGTEEQLLFLCYSPPLLSLPSLFLLVFFIRPSFLSVQLETEAAAKPALLAEAGFFRWKLINHLKTFSMSNQHLD